MHPSSKEVKYSVVIPCFNDGAKVRRAVESCVYQTVKPWEIIVVDDHSREETRSILRQMEVQFAAEGFRCVYLHVNQGVSIARNTGIESASGDYVCFLDADDVWHKDKLLIVDDLVKKQNPHAIGHGFTYDLRDFNKDFSTNRQLPVKYFRFTSVMLQNPLTTPSLVMSSALKLRFNEKMKYAEDHDLIVRLAKEEAIAFIDYPLVFIDRRIGSPGGLSGNRWKMRTGEIRMYVNLCGSYPWLYLFLPALIVFSLLKHLKKKVI